VARVRRDHSRGGILCEVPMGAILGQVFEVAEDDAGGIEPFNVGSGVDELCNSGVAAVGADDDIADGHARTAGILERNADDPSV